MNSSFISQLASLPNAYIITIIIIVSLFFVFTLMTHFIRKRLRKPVILPIDEMSGLEFEKYCAILLEKKGFQDVSVTKASGDFGVDILAEKDGVTYAIQCKCYSEPVGVKAIQEACAGRDFYDRMVGAVLTNQYFTSPAVEAAKKLKILLWDRGYLESMIEEEND